MKQSKVQSEALYRAQSSASIRNYATIISGLVAKGISADEIIPRENVFTFHAWKALGRQVRKGEHGIKITTWIPCKGRKVADPEDEQNKVKLRPKTAVVFHISQTDPIGAESEVA
jgi:antirestriction protein ArdC